MISFAAPWALLGLVAAAVPILLHLLARREPPVVDFPALRYLSDTARVHQRRLTLQHWLLLLARTLLLVLLVLAAAGPSRPRVGSAGHTPSALVLVVDNSLSAAATGGGAPMMDRLRGAASGVLDRATPDDALWLITADGIARRGDRVALGARVDSLTVSPRRLDLGRAVAMGHEILSGQPLTGELMVLSDLQATALSGTPHVPLPASRSPLSTPGSPLPASPSPRAVPLTVARPRGLAPPNAGVDRVELGVQPWTAGGGRVTVHLAAGDSASIPLTITAAGRPARPSLGTAGRPATFRFSGIAPGWLSVTVQLAPDELRLDDTWVTAVRVAPPARVRWDPADRFVAAACEVLRQGGRILPGTSVALGTLGTGPSIVLPPADPAALGALNRALEGRGIPWRFGDRLSGRVSIDSAGLLDRHAVRLRQVLRAAGPMAGDVLLTAAGEPWMVRSGSVVLLASRLDTAWTDLPLSAAFVPFLDHLLNRMVAGEFGTRVVAPGDPAPLPDLADAIVLNGQQVRVEGGASFHPETTGLHFVLAAGDTIGVVSVNADSRESLLGRADDDAVRGLWPGARVVDLEAAQAAAFTAGARGDLRGALLWLALAVGLVEAALAGWRRKKMT
jgi:hypothetical protein